MCPDCGNRLAPIVCCLCGHDARIGDDVRTLLQRMIFRGLVDAKQAKALELHVIQAAQDMSRRTRAEAVEQERERIKETG